MMRRGRLRVISPTMSVRRPPRRFPCLPLLIAAVAALLAPAHAHAAPEIRPWMPPGMDSISVWAAEARAHFQQNTGDSVGGKNYRPYDLVGSMGRRLLASLGRDGLPHALAIKGVLDSLGLDVEVATDPHQPLFTLILVRNSYRPTSAGVAFLHWC